MVWPMKSGKMTDARDQVLSDLPLVPLVHVLDPAEEPGLDVRSLLDRTRHAFLLWLLAVTAADDQPVGGLVPAGPVTHRGLAPRGLRRHAGRATCPRRHRAGGRGGSSPRPGSPVAGPCGGHARPCRGSGSRGRGCSTWPTVAMHGSARGASRPRAGAPWRSRPPWRAAGQTCRRSGRSGRPCPG